ncbi:fibronectin type III domain-containing protein [Fredinandcohnia onubensis]|uniref:fibronectin type III domain-containing protein n=1 Tax=Fredinandcohnia onubensis TaxID=1571209 RepID=UPI000C0BC4F2|nr:fibronectin type III domain-containing protein [Fredinandcohnia onubensis]
MRNRKWLHVSMVLVLLLSLVSPLTISKTHAQNKLSQVSITETENGITLSWEALLPQGEEITNYQLSKNGQATEIEPTVQNGNHYSYEDPEIEPNTTYSYEISAVTSSGNLLTSEKVKYPSKGTSEENTGEAELAGEQAETMGPAETTEPEEATEQDEAETATETLESAEASELTAAADETVTTNIKVSTKNGNIPWDYFSFTIIGVSENVTDIEYYGYLNEEGYFVEY